MFQFRRKRALLLDDDAAMRRLVALLLKRAGYAVDPVSSGNDAIDAIENQQYTAITLDLMMPLEGGMTVIRYLRENAPAMLRRVIVITGAPDGVLDPIRNEIFAVVRKPFHHGDLVETAKRLAKS
ncbi:MAG TPA: response regulator [Thermoanaerobaculia bacterium]|nr:response regulator [Thermoanaerobaculia bacterium]